MKQAIMIAATGSGCGKTTITCALLELLKRKFSKVSSFKCGPDYIDPMFHREVLKVPCRNLDLFFSDAFQLKKLFEADNDSDINVVEGVMGLYDGLSPENNEASSYRIACALDIPIILVVDARGMGHSLIALIKGFLDMDDEHRINGVILNRISGTYAEKISPVIERELGIQVVGSMPITGNVLESRHLGLKLPHEKEHLSEIIKENAKLLNESLNLEKLLAISAIDKADNNTANSHPLFFEKPFTDVKIAVARDEAFCFYYEDNLKVLREAGAELVFFSPLRDVGLPKGISGLILYGGYPELYAKELSENTSLIQDIRSKLNNNMPVLAECGGFMYLHENLITEDGAAFPMVGVVKGACRFTGHLVRFGYASYTDKEHIFLPEGTDSIRGHEFHYFESDYPGSDLTAVKPAGGNSFSSSHLSRFGCIGFPHLYYPSNPELARSFLMSQTLA